MKEFYYKVKDKLRYIYFTINCNSNWKKNYYKYLSYWHYSLQNVSDSCNTSKNYFATRPNPGAGIGHQLANWIAGYWFARLFKLNYAYMPFSNSHIPYSKSKWDDFFGFFQDEITLEELVNNQNYKIIRLPLFDEQSLEQVDVIKGIIRSYQNRKVVFLAEQDQFYREQFGVMDEIQKKFYSNPVRKIETLIYRSDEINIAIHIRRGDIVQHGEQKNDNLSMRWQNNDYFFNALKQAISIINSDKPVAIYLFSQGVKSEFKEFNEFENVHFCLEMSAQESFLHMVMADILITSKSSFSYKAALLNRGMKVCPAEFWHGYPEKKDWILLDDDGNVMKINKIKN